MKQQAYGRNLSLTDDLEIINEKLEQRGIEGGLNSPGPVTVDRLHTDKLSRHYEVQDIEDAVYGDTTKEGKVVIDKENREAAVIVSYGLNEGTGNYQIDVESYGKLEDVVMDLQSRYANNSEVKDHEGLWEL